jgi:RNA polymerase sigma-70 factor (ECF subfamily)
MDERTLIRRAAAGDRQAFGVLVRTHQEGVYRWVRGLVRDEEAARDLTQETFLRSFRALPGFRGEAAFGTWLKSIAANLAKSHLRREAAHGFMALPADLAAPSPAPADALAAERERAALRRALESLPPRQREVVRLRIYGELSYAEIARRVGSTENAAKVNFHHAVKRLRRLLAGSDAGSTEL